MNQSSSSFYVYCINMQCHLSIYFKAKEIQISLTAENLVAIKVCSCCNQKMVSPMSLELEQLLAESGICVASSACI